MQDYLVQEWGLMFVIAYSIELQLISTLQRTQGGLA
jgi:hypothetical protein